jgi:small acid-soluble spore protein F (minor alpha/beta-type SASP)
MCKKAMKGVFTLGRHNSIMSEELKYEIAKELGVDDKVKNEGWGSVSSRDCGNIVTKAIEIAQRSIEK